MEEINYEASLNKLLSDIYIVHKGYRIEPNQGGFIALGGWYSTLEAAKDKIDRSYGFLKNSIKPTTP